MADNDELATARVPVRPSTLDKLAAVAGKRRTYDETVLGLIEARRLLRRVYDKVEREDPEMLSDDLENEIEEVLREGP